MQTLADNTTANVSASAHGYVPKAPNNTTQYLRADGTWNVPSPVAFKNGTTTHDISVAGAQTIAHGLGKTPSQIKITVTCPASEYVSQSTGVYNGTTTSMVYWWDAGYPELSGGSNDNSNIAFAILNNTNSATATVAFDGTNITLTWSKTNTPTGTAYIMWEAIG
jgi:hypothetical protein